MYKCNKAVKKTAQILSLKWYMMMMMMMVMMTFMWVDPVQTWCEWTTWGTPLFTSTTLDWTWRTVTHTYCFYPLLNSDGNRRKGFLTCPFENSIEWVALSEFCGLNINTNIGINKMISSQLLEFHIENFRFISIFHKASGSQREKEIN